MDKDTSYFFCGIGGSGMLPLALIAKEGGADVAGSDRALDQGRIGEKFAWLAAQGIALFPQDGSGLSSVDQTLIASAAIEDSVPDVARARALGCVRMTRAQLLARLFNAAPHRIGVGGTSGKSSVTAMTGWIMHQAGRAPTIMNGAVMKNFIRPDAPFAAAVVGGGGLFISELDESDGSIALFNPGIAVINNITLDHKPLEELRRLFAEFARRADAVVWNADDAECAALIPPLSLPRAVSFAIDADADVKAVDIVQEPLSSAFTISHAGARHQATLGAPGRHNIANALAAFAAAVASGVAGDIAAAALSSYTGVQRRFDIVGTAHGVTVIDDFAHNPDKVAATLATLAAVPGRLHLFFQPHGYGPLRTMGRELADAFSHGMRPRDTLYLCDPVYYGGTVDRSEGSDTLAARIVAAGANAWHMPSREDCAQAIVAAARSGDMIVVMGARDDTLPAFATAMLAQLGNAKQSVSDSSAP